MNDLQSRKKQLIKIYEGYLLFLIMYKPNGTTMSKVGHFIKLNPHVEPFKMFIYQKALKEDNQ